VFVFQGGEARTIIYEKYVRVARKWGLGPATGKDPSLSVAYRKKKDEFIALIGAVYLCRLTGVHEHSLVVHLSESWIDTQSLLHCRDPQKEKVASS
jgi:hypothetical protein